MNKRYMRLIALVCILVCIDVEKGFAQPCSVNTPSIGVNLTGRPDSVWSISNIGRVDQCCGVSSQGNMRCIEFILIIDSMTGSIKFEFDGPPALGNQFLQIECGTPQTVGAEICLSGVGPHRITFCKSGGDANATYRIRAIPKPNLTGKLVANQACNAFLKAVTLVTSSITWQSVPNDSTLNSYLSALGGVDSVSIIPTGNFPSQVTYRVCGNIVGGCASSFFCDTATVRFVSNIDVEISPKNPKVCFGGTNTNITATPVGGLAPYTFLWSTGATTPTINVGPGTFHVAMLD